jgi:hypothetical protein
LYNERTYRRRRMAARAIIISSNREPRYVRQVTFFGLFLR